MTISTKLFVAILLCFSFSCSLAQTTFPNEVKVKKTSKLVRMKGSKLYVNAPATYKPIESLIRLQKNDDTYLQVLEVPNSNFLSYKENMTKEAMQQKGAQVDVDKPVKYNGYSAIYIEGPSKNDGETKLGLAFGDESFIAMIMGVCKTDDKKSKEELIQIIAGSYYDKSFSLNSLELVNYTFDEHITGFKFSTKLGNLVFYTPNGPADTTKGFLSVSCFQIMPLDVADFDKAKEFLESVTNKYSGDGMTPSNIVRKETTINGNKALEMTLDVTDENKTKYSLYQVVINKDKSAVMFVGFDNDKGLYMDKLKKTAQSLRFK